MKKYLLTAILITATAGAFFWVVNAMVKNDLDVDSGSLGQQNPPTSADDAEPGSIHNLPVPEAISKAKKKAAENAGISENNVLVLSVYEREWSDSCLGLGGPAESCALVIVPGYEITFMIGGNEYIYRTNSDGSIIRN